VSDRWSISPEARRAAVWCIVLTSGVPKSVLRWALRGVHAPSEDLSLACDAVWKRGPGQPIVVSDALHLFAEEAYARRKVETREAAMLAAKVMVFCINRS
jgi:hypothetical protein